MSIAATSSIFPRPTASSDPNFGHLRIKDDILYPKDEAPYTGRDLQIRIALFVISQATPIVASILIMLSRKSWWSRNFNWTMSRLVVLWLLSIQIFGAIVYAQKGATTRVLFLAATLHLQIEYMIIALLLKASPLLALGIAYLAGAILLTVQLFLPDLSLVYIISTTFGFTDFLIPLLLAYGKQWLYAAGGFAHLIQAIGVFCIVVKNFGHIEFAAITFVTTWIMNGALVAAIYQTLREAKSGGVAGRIRLNGDEDNNGQISKASQGEAIDNPLAHIDIPRKTVIIMFAVSVVGSVISAFIFTFVVARN